MSRPPRFRLRLAYDGTDFHGWQKQHPPDEAPLRTVQQVVEDVLRQVLRSDEPRILGASRTDAGVHAVGQVAVFDFALPMEPARLVRALDGRLPEDVVCLDADEVPRTFDPINDAVEKEYRYQIAHGLAGVPAHCTARPLLDRRFVARVPPRLDVAAMREGAKRIEGRRDFAAFTRKHHGKESTVRTVTTCRVDETGPGRLAMRIRGDGFLWNMVRIAMGTLVEVGRGKLAPEDVADVLASRDRTRAGSTMPPEGLFLVWIRYAGDPPIDTATALDPWAIAARSGAAPETDEEPQRTTARGAADAPADATESAEPAS